MPKRIRRSSPGNGNGDAKRSRRELEQEISQLKAKLERRRSGSRSYSPGLKKSEVHHQRRRSPSRLRKRHLDREKRHSSSRSSVHSELRARNELPLSDQNKRSYPSSRSSVRSGLLAQNDPSSRSSVRSGLLAQDDESYQSRADNASVRSSDMDEEPQTPSPARSFSPIAPGPAPQSMGSPENYLEEDILQILGVPGVKADTFELHPLITNIWQAILSQGVEKTERTKLLEKFKVPVNLLTLNAPKVNEEITSAVVDDIIKKDLFLINRQNQLGKGLAGIGAALTLLLKNKPQEGFYKELMQNLSDTGRILTDLHFRMSLSRRVLITPHLNKNVKTLTATSPVGEYLFDTDLGEKIKAAKAVERTSKEIKKPAYTRFIANVKPAATKPYGSSLNYRGPLRKERALQRAGQYPRPFRTESRTPNKRRP